MKYIQFSKLPIEILAILLTTFVLDGLAGQSPVTIPAELVIDGQSLGDVVFELTPAGQANVPAAPLNQALNGKVRPEVLATLAKAGPMVSAATLAKLGFATDYDENQLKLSLRIPANALLIKEIGSRKNPAPVGTVLAPADFSVMLGASARVQGLAIKQGDELTNTTFPGISLNPAIRLLGSVLEGNIDMDWQPDLRLALHDIRILRDIPEIDSRLALGMLNANASSFGGTARFYGISMGSIDRQDGASRTPGLEEIVLEQPAKIAVSLNGITIRDYALDKGSYLLADIPFVAGMNDVTVTIREADRPPRMIQVGIPYDPVMLSPGQLEYRGNLGVDRMQPDQLLATLQAAIGITPEFQLGGNFGYGYGQYNTEASLRLASLAGTFGVAAALSFGSAPVPGFASRLTWGLNLPGLPLFPKLGIKAEYRSTDFRQSFLNASPSRPAERLDLGAQIVQSLPAALGNLAVFGGVSLADWQPESWNLAGSLLLPIDQSVMLTVSGGVTGTANAQIQPKLGIALAVLPPVGPTLQARQDVLQAENSLALTIGRDQAIAPVVELRGENLGVSDKPTFGLGLRSSLPAVNLTGGIGLRPTISGQRMETSYSLAVSSSLAFADGYFGLSGNMGDAFAILVPDRSVGDSKVSLRASSGEQTIATAVAPPLVKGIRAYRAFSGSLDLPESLPDLNPESKAIQFVPAYRSGTVIRVSVSPSVVVNAIVLTPGGTIHANQLGSLRSFGSQEVRQEVFTDESGLLEIYSLRPGTWTITWQDRTASTFTVDDNASGHIDLGQLPSTGSAGETEEP